LTESVVLLRHALRPGLGPILAYIGVQIGFLVGGAVIVEGVFAYPGVGLLALNAVRDRDLPVIQAFVVVLALAITLTTTAIDLIARLIDPRIAAGERP
jgi:ABC-type dipeptide/oligopeptide/nickel transport system permease component